MKLSEKLNTEDSIEITQFIALYIIITTQFRRCLHCMGRVPAVAYDTLRESHLNRIYSQFFFSVWSSLVSSAGPQRIYDKVETDLNILWNITEYFSATKFLACPPLQNTTLLTYSHGFVLNTYLEHICGCRSLLIKRATYSDLCGCRSTSTQKKTIGILNAVNYPI